MMGLYVGLATVGAFAWWYMSYSEVGGCAS
jgi:hypothetical protein